MFKSSFIIVIVVISLAAIIFFPLYMTFIEIPQFTQLFRENTLHESAYLAELMADLLLSEQNELSRERLSAQVILKLEQLREESDFIKFRIFASNGEILYSAEKTEIGRLNTEQYFKDIIENGEIVSKEVLAGTESMDGQIIVKDAVEIYVPIERSERIVGVFELYYDTTDQQQKLEKLIYRSYGILFGVSLVLLSAVIGASIKAGRYLKERQEAEEKLRSLSISDEMTGLYNRRGFYALAEQQKKLADRTRRGMLLVMGDLNGLKEINDHFGHEAGDIVLVEAAKVLRESFRESDIIARFGGDEFAVLMLEQPNVSEDLLVSRLNAQVALVNNRHERDYSLSISVGFARYDPDSPRTFDELLSTADTRMYNQKRLIRRDL